MPKLGKRDLFSSTSEPELPLLQTQLEPAGSVGDVEKVMVMLNPRQVNALDRVCLEIRQTTGMKFKRSMLIRALIDGFLAYPHTFREARSYDDIARTIMESFHAEKQAP